jgi:hypothetical protein
LCFVQVKVVGVFVRFRCAASGLLPLRALLSQTWLFLAPLSGRTRPRRVCASSLASADLLGRHVDGLGRRSDWTTSPTPDELFTCRAYAFIAALRRACANRPSPSTTALH